LFSSSKISSMFHTNIYIVIYVKENENSVNVRQCMLIA
jgi:hypothetical protein